MWRLGACLLLGLCGVVPFVFVMSARRTSGGVLGGCCLGGVPSFHKDPCASGVNVSSVVARWSEAGLGSINGLLLVDRTMRKRLCRYCCVTV